MCKIDDCYMSLSVLYTHTLTIHVEDYFKYTMMYNVEDMHIICWYAHKTRRLLC